MCHITLLVNFYRTFKKPDWLLWKLLSINLSVNHQVGGTALHYAASKGHVEVARALLNNRAYVNGRTKVCTESSSCEDNKGTIKQK